ncbi:Wadjet anti-phage system protein JetA family protein [uncultured Oscillibacter sp.]|uniref:Wadjet anti-phage system protein JetA family protein n=1 Tax=uncultured Oscillibacter sp. TaxID=876091 RepID=UPI00260C6BD4|nr:Wadjet anti-phage system protein JetA family protein [uncultured Oscillibacter sp.]
MKLFDAVPNELFSVLASPNRSLYADALDVLYESYQENLKIPEETLYSMLRGKLEQQLAEATFEGEDIDEEELRDVSGRARFLIRKLDSKGWLEKQRGEDFDEYITVPGYSSRLLELFHLLQDDSPMWGYSYVFGTYSTLKVASEGSSVYDKMAAVYSAYDNTQSLIKLLQMVYHNVKHFFQRQINMQNVNVILASHFDDFGQKVVEAYIRPLKIKDSVPKYRVPIQTILSGWLEDDALLTAMSNAALQDRRGSDLNACRSDLLRKIFWVKERYDNIEHEFLDEIDQQVRRYTRATTQKIENLTNRDHNVRGNLNYLLTALSRNRRASELVEQIQPAFQLYEQSFLSEKSVWYRKRPGKRTKAAPVLIQEDRIDPEMARQAQQLLRSEYGRSAIAAYVEQWLGAAGVCYSEDLDLKDDKAYIMSLLAVLTGDDRFSTYTVHEMEGVYSENGYSIPRLQIKRREEKT